MSWTVERLPAVPTTMDLARHKAREGAPDRWAVVADTMTGGRGTHGRAWHAPLGGLYASFVLRDEAALRNAGLLTLALGNAVADVLEVAGVEPRLKWVNDVQVNGKKVAGILVEAESTGGRVSFAVCGIGLNLNGHAKNFPAELRASATTLEDELACDVCIPDLETFLWQSIDKWLATLGHDPKQVVARFRERDALQGRKVRVESGKEVHEGVASGVDELGHLLLQTPKGLRTILAGTVRLA